MLSIFGIAFECFIIFPRNWRAFWHIFLMVQLNWIQRKLSMCDCQTRQDYLPILLRSKAIILSGKSESGGIKKLSKAAAVVESDTAANRSFYVGKENYTHLQQQHCSKVFWQSSKISPISKNWCRAIAIIALKSQLDFTHCGGITIIVMWSSIDWHELKIYEIPSK